MKQEEKSKITYNKIVDSAIIEFGTNNYNVASLNNICSNNNLSKGLIYHHFKNKDQLYLCCVKECIGKLTAYLKDKNYDSEDFNIKMETLFEARYKFFKDNPLYANIFFNIIMDPPQHLLNEIKVIKKEFDDFNILRLNNALESIVLRDNVSRDEVLEYFSIFQEMFNRYYQIKAIENKNLDALMLDHEIKLSSMFNIILYGIAKE